jgi:hypothetical protein
MAFSPTDPASAHSLWLQLRSTQRKRRPQWRSDWAPLWFSLLFLSVLLIVYALMPFNDAAEQATHMPNQENSAPGVPNAHAVMP